MVNEVLGKVRDKLSIWMLISLEVLFSNTANPLILY
uniref:Uncharacterized protein n=1 Tax=Rhizophora mucronata TaxID=61149 RepID=A0A2P2PA50_RHIMU